MALLIKAEELKGLISISEAIAAVRDGFRDQGENPAYSAPRIRIQHEDRRVSVHPGGCHRLQVAGTFIHVERFTFHGGSQQYEKAGKRVYVAYDSETAELKTIIVGSLPLFDEPPEDWFGTETPITGAVGTDLLARPDCRRLGLYGTGRQARRHLVTMCTIRPSIEEVRVFSRSAENRTRFVVVEKGAPSRPRESSSGWKGSIAFVTAHRPGSLAHALDCFARRGVNLTRLDSRPMMGRPFEYRFYVDFSINGEASSPAAAEAALSDLEEASAEIKLFGTYPAA